MTEQVSSGAPNTSDRGGELYLSRRLTLVDEDSQAEPLDETGLISLPDNKIVLGDPGMGKSELMRELGRRLGVKPVTAMRFMTSKNSAGLVQTGKPLIIDALDEAVSRREADAINEILAQLEAAGSPPFILGCRTREWREINSSLLSDIYPGKPKVFNLAPLERDEAKRFVSARNPGVDATHVLEHLDAHSLSELYGNPLTLGFIGRVAESDAVLPATRAALFERVCKLLWSEHDPARQDVGLAQICEDDALDAAGAISASLLLGGAEAVSVSGAAQVLPGDLHIADIERLPNAGAARKVFTSKLFQSVGPSRAKPIHKVVTEFLGARWLARQAASPRAQRRLLAQLRGSDGVSASLRGLHAWLAYHSPAITEAVISADPYGVLRYGEPAALTPSQAELMFDALSVLAQDNPFFRSGDWDTRTAAGLVIPQLKTKIEAIIGSPDRSPHLRSLFIESLRGTMLAAELSSTLELIVLSPDRFYRDRRDAIEALEPHRTVGWWQETVITLLEQATEDSAVLAHNIIEMIEADISDAVLVSTLFAEMGLAVSASPSASEPYSHTVRNYGHLLKKLTDERLPSILDLIAEYLEIASGADWRAKNTIADITAQLCLRAIDAGVVGPSDSSRLWRWLGVIGKSVSYHRGSKAAIIQRMKNDMPLRRAIQEYALAHRTGRIWMIQIELQRRFVGLAGCDEELLIYALEQLAEEDITDELCRMDWCDLLRLACHATGLTSRVRAAADRFIRGDSILSGFITQLENPEKQLWEIEHEREIEARERERAESFETARRRYRGALQALRDGELAFILDPAQAYLGRFHDLTSQKPMDRVAEWLGPELCDDVRTGFEAVFLRGDLPSAETIAEGFSQEKIYNYCYPIMAGLFERVRNRNDISDLFPEVLRTGLLLCYEDWGWHLDADLDVLREALETLVVPTQAAREEFARLWIEPALAKRRSHVPGLYKLAYEPAWQAAAAPLAGAWLATHLDLPESIELELVNCLIHAAALNAAALATLADVAESRSESTFRDYEHMRSWLSIDILVRFGAVRGDLDGLGVYDPDFIWDLRNRFQLERHGGLLHTSVSQAAWIIAEFRGSWPNVTIEGSFKGDRNPHDAADFLRALMERIANDTSIESSTSLRTLVDAPQDSYTNFLRYLAAQQRQKRAEQSFSPLSPAELVALLTNGPPSNIDDLKSLVRDEIDVAQRKLLGDDIDQVRDFWTDDGIPRTENRCRDRLAAIIGPELASSEILRMTEADMPMDKRADLAFACRFLQLPMEIKGQWHDEVWDAASGQLDLQYLTDWRSEQRGIYCVLWFGDLPSATGRRLKAHPDSLTAPVGPAEMRSMLIDRIPMGRREFIDVVVLDLTAGKRA